MAIDGPLIQLRNVSFAYEPERGVLDGADLAVGPGERVGLLGANGSGKTTLLHLIVGLLEIGSGTIEAFGRPRKTERDFHEVRCLAGLLFQDPEDQLFCPTVVEDVAFGPINLGLAHDDALDVARRTLADLGLAGYEDRITYKLSGGEKRLVALGTVLAMEPEVLLLDEPVSGLDEEATARVIDVLARLPQAMLIVSHNRPMLAKMVTRSLCLSGGKLEPVDLASTPGGGRCALW